MSYIEKFYRDATDKDVLRVMKGDEVEARFRDDVGERWVGGSRLGCWVKDSCFPWLDESRSGWTHCQVYDPPQWYLDKPEPGEGYRLLAKFPDETLQAGDEVFDLRGDRKWELSFNVETKHPQNYSSWYRRRIEQPKPEPKHYVLRVGDTVETPSGHLIKIVDRPTEQMHYSLRIGDTADVPSGHRIAITEHGVEVT